MVSLCCGCKRNDERIEPLLIRENLKCKNKGPLLAFAGGGLIWAYYLGVIAFLRDHFNLIESQVLFSGVSCGCSAAITLFFDLSIIQGFQFGYVWKENIFDKRPLKCFCMSTKVVLNALKQQFKLFNITDDTTKQQYNKYGQNCLYFGCTALTFNKYKLNLYPMIMDSFTSLHEMIYSCSCSMRVLPLFRKIAYWNGYYCIDGIFSQKIAIPTFFDKKKDRNRIISIDGGKNCDYADIYPDKNDQISRLDQINPFASFDFQVKRFEVGYRDASKLSVVNEILIGKGLKLLSNYQKIINDEARWNKHINQQINNHKQKLYDHFAHLK